MAHAPTVLLMITALLSPAFAPAPGEETTLLRLDGSEISDFDLGTIDERGGVLGTTGEKTEGTRLADLRSIVFPRTPGTLGGPRVLLQRGGEIAAEVLSASAETLRLKSAHLTETEIPLAEVRAFRLAAGEIDEGPFRSQLDRDDKEDSIFVIQDDGLLRIAGGLKSLDAEGLSFTWSGGDRTVAREKVFGLVLPPTAGGGGTEAVRVRLVDGSRLVGEVLSLDAERLRLRTPGGVELAVARPALCRIDVRSDRLIYLSDLEPSAVEEFDFFAEKPRAEGDLWLHAADRSVDGNPLRLGGRTYEKGLGVRARSVLTYDLVDGAEAFVAVIGIDDETEGRGHVVFRVHVDGEVAYQSEGVRGKDEPRRIRVDVTGKKKLVLEVDFGQDQDIGDHADWADAHIIRKG